jgi:hypothetical protein
MCGLAVGEARYRDGILATILASCSLTTLGYVLCVLLLLPAVVAVAACITEPGTQQLTQNL